MTQKTKNFLLSVALTAVLLLIVAGIDRCDRARHSDLVGKRIVLGNDTVEVIEWRNSRYQRGYLISTGYVADKDVVENAEIVK